MVLHVILDSTCLAARLPHATLRGIGFATPFQIGAVERALGRHLAPLGSYPSRSLSFYWEFSDEALQCQTL